MTKRLYRDEYHKVLGGVCSGLAEYFEMDVTVLRLLFAFTVIIMGVGVIPYIVLWIVLPKKRYLFNSFNNPTVDYTVPNPDEQYTHQGNPFGQKEYYNVPSQDNPLTGQFPAKRQSTAGLILGVVMILIGGAILIDEFDLIPDFDFERLWPVVLVVVGAFLIVSGREKRAWHHDNWNEGVKDASVENETPADNNPAL